MGRAGQAARARGLAITPRTGDLTPHLVTGLLAAHAIGSSYQRMMRDRNARASPCLPVNKRLLNQDTQRRDVLASDPSQADGVPKRSSPRKSVCSITQASSHGECRRHTLSCVRRSARAHPVTSPNMGARL
jgi:hypothetical protein